MTTGRIEMSRTGKVERRELSVNRLGTREEIRKSGESILRELRATNKKAKVWIDGKLLRLAGSTGSPPAAEIEAAND
jgi:hypothetical protein